MTAVLPSGSPGFEDEDAQSWEFLRADAGSFVGSASASGSGDFGMAAHSPSMKSQGSWVNINSNAGTGQQLRPLSTPSPIMSVHDALSVSSYPAQAAFGAMPTSTMDNTAMLEYLTQQLQHQSQEQLATQALIQEMLASPGVDFSNTPTDEMMMPDFSDPSFGLSLMPEASYTTLAQQLGIPPSMQQHHASTMPWAPMAVQNDVFLQDQFATPPPPRSSGSSSISLSPRSPVSPAVPQPRRVNSKKSSPQPIPKKPAGVQKTQRRKPHTSPRGSGSTSPADPKLSDGILMFCNQTPDNWGKGAGFGADMETLERSSHKGRKGALSEEVRANALEVRQKGACLCCHWRKVKCSGERPCNNCKKLCQQVPEAVCFKFQDFNDILFPDFIRRHLRREETTKFIADNVASFAMNGVDVPARVTLSSGPLFAAKLVVNAKFFTARDVSSDVLQQWYQFMGADGFVELEALRAAPIGLDINITTTNSNSPDGGGNCSQRNELRRKVEAYADALVAEPSYALQLTDSQRKTDVPCRILHIVQRYALASGAPIVRRAMAIYAMHYVMTRHLTMTPASIAALAAVNPEVASAAAGGPFLTPRLLNRQIKAVLDDVMQQEVSALFDDFMKRLKQKSHEQWAPCLAAFLVFTLLLEAIETAADVYAVAENEIEMRGKAPARFRRAEALAVNERIENMPFKQFAYQFHHRYATHSRDATKVFNPLSDEGVKDLAGLGPDVEEFVLDLKSMVELDWSELDWLSCDPILPNQEGHPFPMNLEQAWSGRLISKFLLSFQGPGYIFASA